MSKISRRQLAGGALAAGAITARPALAQKAPSQPLRRDILSGAFGPESLTRILLAREQWWPFPPAADRAPWQALPADVRESLVEAGRRQLEAPWAELPATFFLDYVRTGNRSHGDNARANRRAKLQALVVAECVENAGRFLDAILNGIWLTCEETYWGSPAHLGIQKAGSGLPDAAEPTVDLFAAETAAMLAWTGYLLEEQLDKLSPLVRRRILLEADRRVLRPNEERVDFWWMGLDPKGPSRALNNWTPWICSNWLTTALLLEPDARRRAAAVYKNLRSLDKFLESYHPDGGCDEGPSYWGRAGGSLFDCLELLYSASGGKLDFYQDSLIREIGRYIYRAHIHSDYYVNFADASARLQIASDLVYRYGKRIGDDKMQLLGAWAAGQREKGVAGMDSLGRQLPAIFNAAALRAAPQSQPLVRDVWLPGIQVMAARLDEGSARGLYLAAQGGHNAESHNHNDVGNFVVYGDGQPVIIDVGVETYTAKTFSSRRYEIWTMQSAYHNLPTVNGVMQSAGRNFEATEVAYRAEEGAAELRLNIAKAYPPEAGLKAWRRTLRLDRAANVVEVRDRYALSQPSGQISMTLMCARRPVEQSPGRIALDGPPLPSGPVRVEFDPRQLTPRIEEIAIEDNRLKHSWGERLYRLLLVAERAPQEGEWSIRIRQGR